jgi:Putative Flp pilus-assembly TadE/G-like
VKGAGERGTVAVTVALALTVLLGIAALVVDVGLSWAARAKAQTAADAAALAGAGRLAAGPAEVVAAVRQYLDANVAGLTGVPADPGRPHPPRERSVSPGVSPGPQAKGGRHPGWRSRAGPSPNPRPRTLTLSTRSRAPAPHPHPQVAGPARVYWPAPG